MKLSFLQKEILSDKICVDIHTGKIILSLTDSELTKFKQYIKIPYQIEGINSDLHNTEKRTYVTFNIK